jgi:hypothetical protein
LLSLFPFRDRLTSFGINDVHLDESPTPVFEDSDDDDDLASPLLDVMAFENMHNTRCVRQIMDFFEWSSEARFTRCRLGPGRNGVFNQLISLKEIDISENLVAFLAECSSARLVLDGCPGFNDKVLHAMLWRSCASSVEILSIRNCSSFSISTLKKVVEARRIHSIYFSTGITTLRLSGRVPDVSLEDREWFKGCLSEFSYNPIQ